MQPNYRQLLKIKYKTSVLLVCIIFMIFLIVVLSFLLETYSIYTNMAIYNEYLLVNVPIENSDAVLNGDYILINNKKHKYKIIEISELKINAYQNYQEYKILINSKFKLNEVLNITFYYNKEKIFKKIVDVIF